jgi:hypothetical protein
MLQNVVMLGIAAVAVITCESLRYIENTHKDKLEEKDRKLK